MRRSGFCYRLLRSLVAVLVVTLPAVCASSAQSSLLRVAVLTPGITFDPLFHGLQEGLARFGYKEGKNVTFIVEDTKGSTSGLASRAAQLLTAKPDVLFAVTTPHAIAAKQATTTVPIVFAWVAEPVQAGLIASYVSSKNNLTGISSFSASLSGKRLEALLEVAPKVRRLLAIVMSKESITQSSFRFLEESAKKLGVQLVRRDAMNKEEIEQALRETSKGAVDAIYHVPSPSVGIYIGLLIEKAKRDRIPLVVVEDSLVEQGALLSYGPDFRLVGVQSARLVAKVLKEEKPAEIPSETPEKLLLVVNLNTAKAIGLKVPREVLERADQLVE